MYDNRTAIEARIRSAILALYLEHGRNVTCAEIATRLDVPPVRVDSWIGTPRSEPIAGIEQRTEQLRNDVGWYLERTYGPSREYLSDLLARATKSLFDAHVALECIATHTDDETSLGVARPAGIHAYDVIESLRSGCYVPKKV